MLLLCDLCSDRSSLCVLSVLVCRGFVFVCRMSVCLCALGPSVFLCRSSMLSTLRGKHVIKLPRKGELTLATMTLVSVVSVLWCLFCGGSFLHDFYTM